MVRAETLIFNVAAIPTKGNIKQITKVLKKEHCGLLNIDECYLFDSDNSSEPDEDDRRILYTLISSVGTFQQLREEALSIGWAEDIYNGVYSLIQ